MDESYKDHIRQDRLMRGFTIRLIAWATLLVVIFVFVAFITKTPIIDNSLALKQFENSDEWFVAMTMHQELTDNAIAIRNALSAIILGVVTFDGLSTIRKISAIDSTINE